MRGKKITNEQRAEIITSYALTNSYNATAKQVGVSWGSVKKVVLDEKENNTEKFEKICEEKKEEFADKASRVVDKAIGLIETRINRAVDEEKAIDELIEIVWGSDKKNLNESQKKAIVNKLSKLQLNNLSELTTAMGTVYDKMRLARGEATSNNSISITMDSDVAELSK